MFRLEESSFAPAWDTYRATDAFFPLIAAVLLGEQHGRVYANNATRPSRIYVEHAFGFAQTFGADDPLFDQALERYLMIDKSFAAEKVRLYTPSEPRFLSGDRAAGFRSERQRFVLDIESKEYTTGRLNQQTANIETRVVSRECLSEIEACFGIVERFWPGKEEFIAKSHAVTAWLGGEPAAICYAAAIANGQAEIDVFTQPKFRQSGLGKLVVQAFCEECIRHDLRPVWDCFTNNAGSLALCRACGFIPHRAAYPFYTFAR